VQFPDEAAIDSYMGGPARLCVLNLKDVAARAAIVIKGFV
jgi:hypothetical protein